MGQAFCLAGAGLGLVGLSGWLLGRDALTTIVPGGPPMMPAAGAVLVLLGLGGALRRRAEAPRWQVGLSLGAGALALFMAGAILLEYALSVDLGVDRLPFRVETPGPFPGRPSLLTAAAGAPLGAALLGYDIATPRGGQPRQWLCLTAAMIGFAALVGHACGAGAFYQLGRGAPSVGVALHTALALLLIAAGLLLERPGSGFMRIVTSPGPGGRIVRRLGAASALLPVGVDLVLTRGIQIGDPPLVLAASTAVTAVISSAIVVAVARPLERAHSALDSIISIAADAIICIDDRLRITMFNQAAEDIFGWSKDDVVGLPLSVLTPERLREHHHRQLDRFVQEPASARRVAERGPMVGLRKNGEEFPAEAAISKLESESGRVLTVTVRDLTEQEKQVAELRFQGAIAGHLSEGVFLMRGEDGRIVYTNPRFEEMFGYGPGELSGEHVSIVNAPADLSPEQTADAIMAHIRRTGAWHGEIENIKKDGTRFWCYASVSTFDHPRLGLVWVAVHTDISERKRMEEERALALREKEVLLKEIHHRVKNNLQVISSLLYLQGRRSEDRSLQQLLDESRSRVQAIALVHDQLYRSANLAEIDFAEYVQTLCNGIQATYAAFRIGVEVDAPGVLMDIEHAVPCGLLVSELVSNALKHAFPDERAGTVRVSVREGDARDIVLTVADDGAGIPEGVDWGGSRSLGLMLVQSLATQLGGSIELDRSSGTCFTVRFQLAPDPEPEAG